MSIRQCRACGAPIEMGGRIRVQFSVDRKTQQVSSVGKPMSYFEARSRTAIVCRECGERLMGEIGLSLYE